MEIELFVHFAEIAGVFVGFGALISLRSAQPIALHDVSYLQGVLGLGLWVVINALVPIAVSRYGVEGHTLWLPCALVALTIWAVFEILYSRTPASKALGRNLDRFDRFFPVVGLPLHIAMAGSLLLIIFGVWPGGDEALYVTALTAGVVFAGYALLVLVISPGREAQPDQGDE